MSENRDSVALNRRASDGDGQPLIRGARDMKASDIILSTQALAGQPEGVCATIFRWVATGICALILLVVFPLWFWYIKVFKQYERCVHFRLGKIQQKAKGPGIFVFIPFIDSWETVDMRIATIEIPTQEMMTKDSVTCSVNAVVYFHVRDPIKSIACVEDYEAATLLLAQTSLRSVVGDSELDELLQKRDTVNHKMTSILDHSTEDWGVRVVAVEVKDVVLPKNMQRAMGSQAEAERERRAKIISAEGEVQAAGNLLKAANNMTANSATMQLRYLQTLNQISAEKPSTIIFPLPMELGGAFPLHPHPQEFYQGEQDTRVSILTS